MTRLCVIGNSHIGLLTSDDALPVLASAFEEITFFACHSSLVKGLKPDAGSLVADNDELRAALEMFSGGRTRIDIADYDAFVIIGHEFGIFGMLELYPGFLSDSMPGPAGEKYRLSDECFLAAARQVALRSEALWLADFIRSQCRTPVVVISESNPGEGLPESFMPWWYLPFYAAEKNGDATAIAALFRELCARLAYERRIAVLPPMAEVAASGLFIRREFSRLPAEINLEDDYDFMNLMTHANDKYGLRLLPHVFRALGIEPKATP